jgi:predicted enzyme related to lactoylglutathione lyase
MYVQFVELPVSNQDRAKAFYIEHFGGEVVADVPMGPHGWRWIELRFPDAVTTLHFLPRKNEEPSKGPVLVFVDPRVEEIVSRLRSEGVEIVTDPQPAPWGTDATIAEFRDSEGNKMVIRNK